MEDTPCKEVCLDNPYGIERKVVAVDSCLSTEIEYLWNEGIITHGCCCGHSGAYPAWIGVGNESIEKMQELGYERHHNPIYPQSNNYFKPKTSRKCKEMLKAVK